MKVLVTGGAGYIGSHTVYALIAQGNSVVIFDNLSRGHREAVHPDAAFFEGDLLNSESLDKVFEQHSIDAVIHFAAFAYVGESVSDPEMYYTNNVVGSFNLLKSMRKAGVNTIVFSSTCSIYGNTEIIPISETNPVGPINPYAKTKYIIELMLQDYALSYGFHYVALRYFNAAGASVTGEIGESHEPESHLIPLVLFTLLNKNKEIKVFGEDYPTEDGTCIRDYIHVDDLADAHLRAVDYLMRGGESTIINLGTGAGNSVHEVITKSEQITGLPIPKVVVERRAGDPAMLIADNNKAKTVLGWNPKYGIQEILETAWKWHKNPKY